MAVKVGKLGFDLKVRFDTIYREIAQRSIGYMNQQGGEIARIASQRAPVRRAFYQRRKRKFQRFSVSLADAQERTLRARLGVATEGRIVTNRDPANALRPSLPIGPGGRRESGDFRRVQFNERSGRYELSDPRARGELTYRGRQELARDRYPDLTVDERGEVVNQLAAYRADQRLPEGQRKGVQRPSLSVGTSARGKNPSAIYQGRLGGRLRGEIDVLFGSISQAPRLEVTVISPTPYARYVEFGTRHAAAQPYLRPALMHIRQGYRDGFVKALSGRRR